MARTREETSDEENSEQAIPNKRLRQPIYENGNFFINLIYFTNMHKSNEPARAPFEPINFNNTVPIPANNSNFINPNLTYNTHSSNKDSSRQLNSYNHYKENYLKSNLQPQHILVNSYNMAITANQRHNNNSKEFNFLDEQSLAEINPLEPTDNQIH
ncbi:1458_t:CDS:2, partial [Gigaspora rosea]